MQITRIRLDRLQSALEDLPVKEALQFALDLQKRGQDGEKLDCASQSVPEILLWPGVSKSIQPPASTHEKQEGKVPSG